MSGIVGAWSFDGKPLGPKLLDDLMSPVAHRGPDGLRWWAEGPIAMGCAQLKVTPESETEVMPLLGRNGAVLVWDGRLDNRQELVSTLRNTSPDVTPTCPDPVLAMAAYDRWDDRFPERLNGDFALAIYDRVGQRMLLVRDAMGLRQLYWAQSGTGLVFSTQIGSILAHPGVSPQPNRDLLAEYFLLGPLRWLAGLRPSSAESTEWPKVESWLSGTDVRGSGSTGTLTRPPKSISRRLRRESKPSGSNSSARSNVDLGRRPARSSP